LGEAIREGLKIFVFVKAALFQRCVRKARPDSKLTFTKLKEILDKSVTSTKAANSALLAGAALLSKRSKR